MPEIIVVPDQEVKNQKYQKRNASHVIKLQDSNRLQSIVGNMDTEFSYLECTNTHLVVENPSDSVVLVDEPKEQSTLVASYYNAVTLDGNIFALCNDADTTLDDLQKKHHAELVNFISKKAVELLANYDSASSLNDNINTVIDNLKTEIHEKYPQKNGIYFDNLIAGRVFKTDKGYQVVGFNFGSTSCVAYNPATKQFINIAPASVTTGASECYSFNRQVSEGSYLLTLTRAISAFLPSQPSSLNNRELEPKQMKKILSKTQSLKACVTEIMRTALTNTEVNRSELIFSNMGSSDQPLSSLTKDQTTTEKKEFGGDAVVGGFKLATKKEQDEYFLTLFETAIRTQYNLQTPKFIGVQPAPNNFLEEQAWNNIEKFIDHFGLETVLNMLHKLYPCISIEQRIDITQKEFVDSSIRKYFEICIAEQDNTKLKNITKNTKKPELLLNIFTDIAKKATLKNSDESQSSNLTEDQLKHAQRVIYDSLYQQQLVQRMAYKKTASIVSGIFFFTAIVPIAMYLWYRYKVNQEEIQIRTISTKPQKSNVQKQFENQKNNEAQEELLSVRPSIDIRREETINKLFLHDHKNLRKITVSDNNPYRMYARRGIQTNHIDAQQSCCVGLKK